MSPASSQGLPRRFGKYELLERIGSGGMAEIHRARLPGIGGFEKIVVIKSLLPHVGTQPGMVQMFVEEARLAALVQHPNVVQVFELDRTEDGELFIVMEWVRGTDLRRLLRTAAIRQVRIPPWFSAYAVARVLDGLAYAHELRDEEGRRRNVVHRDIAPDNVFVSTLGEIKLGDFGVARDDTRGPEPFAGQLKGKLSYMAPELFSGARPDQRCDVFSAGVVLWECLTQRALFRGESARETMQLVCGSTRQPPSSIADGIPAALDACVLAAIEADPSRRTPSARDFELALLEILPSLSVSAGSFAVREVLAAMRVELPTTASGPAVRTPGGPAVKTPLTTVTPAGGRAPPCPPPAELADELSEDLVIEIVSTIEEATPAPLRELDGEYEIVGSRRIAGESAPTRDLMFAVVHPIPIPGQPSSIETSDIVARKRARTRRRRSMTGSAELWAPYDGPSPFWVRSVGQREFGPIALFEVLDVLRASAADPAERSVEISADRKSWMHLERLRSLAMIDLAEPSRTIPSSAEPRTFQIGTVTELCGLADEVRATGRLRVWHEPRSALRFGAQDAAPGFTEISLLRGEPTHVFTTLGALELPLQLVSARLLDEPSIEAAVHQVVRRGQSIETVLRGHLGFDLVLHWSQLMAARVEPLWALGTVCWVHLAEPPMRRLPFARDLAELRRARARVAE